MLLLENHTYIYVAKDPLDCRKGIDGTAGICRNILQKDPFSGAMFVFINRRKTMIRIYLFDGHGEWLNTKRIAHGRFKWWKEQIPSEISIEALAVLLKGALPTFKLGKNWKEIKK